jgi:hypothetical protein
MKQYAKRKIDVTINLGEGQFGDDKGQDVTLSGLRVSAEITYYGGAIQAEAHIHIFGLPMDMINQLTRVGMIGNQVRCNTIRIAAGEEGGAMSDVYQGTIAEAFGDFQNAPEVVFTVLALGSFSDAIKPVPASSYKGAVDAAVVMANLAELMGLAFENNDVSVMLSNPYYPGTAWQQVKDCAQEAGISVEVQLGKLAIWPRNGYRKGNGPIKISPETGMVGYPAFSSKGITVRTLFNQDVVTGGQIEVASELAVACGVWNAYNIVHMLESETPNGQWFTQISCTPAPQGITAAQ